MGSGKYRKVVDVNEYIFNELGYFGDIVEQSRKELVEGFVREENDEIEDLDELRERFESKFKEVEKIPPRRAPFELTFDQSSFNRWTDYRSMYPDNGWIEFKKFVFVCDSRNAALRLLQMFAKTIMFLFIFPIVLVYFVINCMSLAPTMTARHIPT